MELSRIHEDLMAYKLLSVIAPEATAPPAETRIAVRRDVEIKCQPADEQMLRIANRLLASLKGNEQILACTGVKQDDPGASFVLRAALAIVHLGYGPVLVIDAELTQNGGNKMNEMSISEANDLFALDTDLVHSIRHSTINGLDILSSGNGSALTHSMLASSRIRSLYDALRIYKLVIIDVGRILDSALSLMMASKADVVVAVASAGNLTKRDVARLQAEMASTRARFLGVVLTDKK